jgi:P2-related tail formation protein
MPRPVVAALTDRAYASLPATYQDADEPLDFPLLRFLSSLTDLAAEVDVLHDRLSAHVPGKVSELADPAKADLSWLPWLAQLVGVRLPPELTGQAARDAVAFASSGYRSGTKAAVADAARSALTGARYVKVHDHSITEPGNGGQWDVLLVTRVSDTPNVQAVLDAVVSKRAKPAGVVLHHRAYSATYAQVQGGTTPDTYQGRLDTFPTYQDASDYLPPGA